MTTGTTCLIYRAFELGVSTWKDRLLSTVYSIQMTDTFCCCFLDTTGSQEILHQTHRNHLNPHRTGSGTSSPQESFHNAAVQCTKKYCPPRQHQKPALKLSFITLRQRMLGGGGGGGKKTPSFSRTRLISTNKCIQLVVGVHTQTGSGRTTHHSFPRMFPFTRGCEFPTQQGCRWGWRVKCCCYHWGEKLDTRNFLITKALHQPVNFPNNAKNQSINLYTYLERTDLMTYSF